MKGNVYIHNQAGGNLLLVPVAASRLSVGIGGAFPPLTHELGGVVLRFLINDEEKAVHSFAKHQYLVKTWTEPTGQHTANGFALPSPIISDLLVRDVIGLHLFAEVIQNHAPSLGDLFTFHGNKKGAEAPVTILHSSFVGRVVDFDSVVMTATTSLSTVAFVFIAALIAPLLKKIAGIAFINEALNGCLLAVHRGNYYCGCHCCFADFIDLRRSFKIYIVKVTHLLQKSRVLTFHTCKVLIIKRRILTRKRRPKAFKKDLAAIGTN